MTLHAQVWTRERPRLIGLAYRILGSWQDAEDVVSQAWTRLAGQNDLDHPAAWLTTVVTRLAIDEARRERRRRETYVGPWLPEPVATARLPEEVVETRALLGLAMLRLMEALEPEDRAIFVLREAFDVPYAQIADCVGRSPAACRQVVARTRARLAGHSPDRRADDPQFDLRLLTALTAAVVSGDVAEATRLVSDDCVLWTDGGGATKAALRPIHGPDKILRFLLAITARAAVEGPRVLDVNGRPALWFRAGVGDRLVALEHDGRRITAIQIHGNPAKLTFVHEHGLLSAQV